MKKLFLILSGIILIGTTQAFADKIKDIDKEAAASFSRDFANAKNVTWVKQKNFVKATFTLNDQVLYAYYSNGGGELLAIVRNILTDRLPLSLMTTLKRNYSGYWITNLFEMVSENQTTYYATLESSEETLILKSYGFQEWTVYKKTKKGG